MRIYRTWAPCLGLLLIANACERSESSSPRSQGSPFTPAAIASVSRWPADPLEAQAVAADDSAVRALPMCGAASTPLTGDSIGPLRPGLSLAQVDTLCPHSIAQWDLGDEAIPEPSLAVNLGGASVMLVLTDTLSSSTIFSLLSKDERLRTSEGIGVGSTVQQLRQRYGTLTLGEAECWLYATLARAPGLSFRVTIIGVDTCEGTGKLPASVDSME